MNSEAILTALRQGDWILLEDVPSLPDGFAVALEGALPKLERRTRQLAVTLLVQDASPTSTGLLVRMTRDKNSRVAADAALGLLKISPLPPVGDAAALVRGIRDPFVRGCLYRVIGRTNDPVARQALTETCRDERNREARKEAQVALARLGSQEERKAFLERIQSAKPGEVREIEGQMEYVADPKAARGLLPWFESENGVLTLDPHGECVRIRMCDFAVWIAARLGVRFEPAPKALDRFDEGVQKAAREAVRKLPDWT